REIYEAARHVDVPQAATGASLATNFPSRKPTKLALRAPLSMNTRCTGSASTTSLEKKHPATMCAGTSAELAKCPAAAWRFEQTVDCSRRAAESSTAT